MEKIIRRNRIQLVCGQAKPGPNLSFLKNMVQFCKEFNEKTKGQIGKLVSVEITVYDEKNYKYTIGTSPSTYLLKDRRNDFKELKNKEERKKVREKERTEISSAELEKIAQEMMPSLNTDDLEKAKKIVAGTVRSFGNFKIN